MFSNAYKDQMLEEAHINKPELWSSASGPAQLRQPAVSPYTTYTLFSSLMYRAFYLHYVLGRWQKNSGIIKKESGEDLDRGAPARCLYE